MRLADQLDDLVARGLVDRARRRRTRPGDSVHHQWNSSPPSPQSRRFHSRRRRRDVAVVVGAVLEPERHLPAHVGLPVERPLAGLERGDVQRAAGAAGEAGPVEEDARVVDEPGDRGRCRRRRLPVAGTRLASPSRGTALLGLEPHERLDDGLHVVVVDEVGAVAAAALLQLGGVGRRARPCSRRRRCSCSWTAGTWRRTPTSAARRGPRS